MFMVVRNLIASLTVLLPLVSFPQSEDDQLEAEKLEIIEKMYDREDRLRLHIPKQLSDDEVESRLFIAIDDYASCLVAKARLEALRQNQPLEAALSAIWIHSSEPGYDQNAAKLDMKAFRQVSSLCLRYMVDFLRR